MRKLLYLVLSGLFLSLLLQVDDIQAQTKQSRYGEDSATCVRKISLYREFFKQWKGSGYKSSTIDDAMKSWRWVFTNCPMGTQNTYVDGVKMFSSRIKNAKDEETRQKYIDTVMMIYDQRIEYFPLHYKTKKQQEGNILGRKGVDLYQYRPDSYEEVYNILKRSVELEGNNSKSAVLVYYFRVTSKMINDEKIPKEVIVETYDNLIEIIDWNIKNNSKKKSDYENAKGNIELTFEPYATCEDLIGIYIKKFEAEGDDPEVLSKIISMLDKRGCTDSELYFNATVKLYDLQPTPVSAFLIGRMYLKHEDYELSLDYLKAGTEMEDLDKRADCFLLLADTYRNLNNFPKARTYALKVTELRPGDGNPYILIGDMYAASAKKCGDNDLTNKVAYWAAVDKYYKAKKIDESAVDAANERISAYSKVFPSVQIIFFHNLNEGDPYTVGCWINENTKVRPSK